MVLMIAVEDQMRPIALAKAFPARVILSAFQAAPFVTEYLIALMAAMNWIVVRNTF